MPESRIALSKDRLNIIVAYTDKNRYIGLENDLPWKRSLNGDMRFMNALIRLEPQAALIMGRRTFQSMPRKKGIAQIVLTHDAGFAPAGVVVLDDFEKAVEHCRANGHCAIVFGGRSVYAAALKHRCRIFFTLVEEDSLRGDTCYPGHDGAAPPTNITEDVNNLLASSGVEKTWECDGEKFSENGHAYRFFVTEN